MPFPLWLRWALLAPLAALALGMVLATLLSGLLPGNTVKSVALLLYAGSGVVELLAVPVALFLLVRGDPYLTKGNILMTMAAAIPAGLVIAAVLVLRYGHFHI